MMYMTAYIVVYPSPPTIENTLLFLNVILELDVLSSFVTNSFVVKAALKITKTTEYVGVLYQSGIIAQHIRCPCLPLIYFVMIHNIGNTLSIFYSRPSRQSLIKIVH